MIIDLELKLNGKLPITREELFILVSSWGRKESFTTHHDNIFVERCLSKECYNLSNLDLSEITDLSYIFKESLYIGDLSKWDVSSCTNMEKMFFWADFNNNSLNNWNVSNVFDMSDMFSFSKFNGDISKWDISNVINFESSFDNCPFDGDISKWKFNEDVDCFFMFSYNENFMNKYNAGNNVPNNSKDFLSWFEANKKTFSNLNISKEEELDMEDYLNNFDEKELINGN